jgi:hypothetical protein
MSISSIANTAANSAQTTANSQTNFRQSLNQLFSDVSSGNLSDAQQAYSTLSDLQSSGQGPSATSNTPLAQTLNQIGQSLQNGDISVRSRRCRRFSRRNRPNRHSPAAIIITAIMAAAVSIPTRHRPIRRRHRRATTIPRRPERRWISRRKVTA